MVLKTASRICSSVCRFTTAKRAISCILSANWYSAEYGGTTFHAAMIPITKIAGTKIAFSLPSPPCARCPRVCFLVGDNFPLLLCFFTDWFYMPKLAPRPLPVDTSGGQVVLGANPVFWTVPQSSSRGEPSRLAQRSLVPWRPCRNTHISHSPGTRRSPARPLDRQECTASSPASLP